MVKGFAKRLQILDRLVEARSVLFTRKQRVHNTSMRTLLWFATDPRSKTKKLAACRLAALECGVLLAESRPRPPGPNPTPAPTNGHPAPFANHPDQPDHPMHPLQTTDDAAAVGTSDPKTPTNSKGFLRPPCSRRRRRQPTTKRTQTS